MRQQSRRAAFQYAFSQMPYVETWQTTHEINVGTFNKPVLTHIVRHHVRTIPRRVRRSMARIRAKRK